MSGPPSVAPGWIPLQGIALARRGLPGVERGVPAEPERGAVKHVRPRARHLAHGGARRPAGLRFLRAGADAELGERVGKRRRHVAFEPAVVVHRAVERVEDAHALATRHRDRGARRHRPADRAGADVDRGAREGDEGGGIARRQRRLEDAFTFHDLGDRHGTQFHLELRRAAPHFDRFRELAGFERGIDHEVRAHLQHDVGLRERAEALQRRLQAGGPGLRLGNTYAALVGDGVSARCRCRCWSA